MSTLWTPGGERPIRRDPQAPAGEGGGSSSGGDGGDDDREPTVEERRAAAAALQRELAEAPAEIVVANHAYGLFELAGIYLSAEPPLLEQARLAIDAFAAIVDGLGPRLGDAHHTFAEGLAAIRMTFVRVQAATQAAAGRPDPPPGPAGGPGSGGE